MSTTTTATAATTTSTPTPTPPTTPPPPSPTTTTTALPARTLPRTRSISMHQQPKAETRDPREADVVIVGAGVVGCAAAVAFGRQGRRVLLLERSLKEPDRIVGELLQPGGVQALRALGLADCLEAIDAIPCYGYQVSYHGEPVHIPYPAGPAATPAGCSFHHGRFIQKLRAAARGTPNVTMVETTVTDLVKDTYTHQVLGVECQTAGHPDYYFGALTLVADGYASKFRKAHIQKAPEVRSKFWGLELLDAELPMPNHGHVVLSDAPPILIYQIGTRETRILIDIPENLPSASPQAGGVKNHLLNVALPNLPACVQPSFRRAIAAGKLRSMPNSFLPPATQKTPGIIILGDAMNMRHPLTGGGMTVAFNDVVHLSQLLSPANVPNLEDTRSVLRAMSQFHWARKSSSAVINILAMSLYSLFAADDAALSALQNGCFRYFQRGGRCIEEPCGLLSGQLTNPTLLIYHFFAVAFYAVWCRMRDGPVWRVPYVLFVESVLIIWKAAMVIGPFLLAEMKS